MATNFSRDDLDYILINPERKVKRKIKGAVKKMRRATTKIDVPGNYLKGGGDYIISKHCPVDCHACVWMPDAMESTHCGFYNAYKGYYDNNHGGCVYPKTCINNTSSEHYLNMYNNFSGNIRGYFESGDKDAGRQIVDKCKELGIDGLLPRGWTYAEFDDDGKSVNLAELGTDGDISKLVEECKGLKNAVSEVQAVKEMEDELFDIMGKYSQKKSVHKDIKRILKLYEELYIKTGKSPFE